MDELENRLNHPNRKRPFLCITIDDGYKDNLTYGLPIFEKNKIPFALFVTTNFISNKKAFNWPFIVERIIKKDDELIVEGEVYSCKTLEDKSSTFQRLRALILSWDYKELESHFKAYVCTIYDRGCI